MMNAYNFAVFTHSLELVQHETSCNTHSLQTNQTLMLQCLSFLLCPFYFNCRYLEVSIELISKLIMGQSDGHLNYLIM